MKTDSLGRRRRDEQNTGLRPMYPLLDDQTESRAVRITMSRRAWMLFDALASRTAAPTRARAAGAVLERSLAAGRRQDWLQWQIAKERSLLDEARQRAG